MTDNNKPHGLGTFEPKSQENWLDKNILLTGVTLVTTRKDGSPLPFGPYYHIEVCDPATGEVGSFPTKGSKLFEACQKAEEGNDFPYAVRLIRQTTGKKAWTLGEWK